MISELDTFPSSPVPCPDTYAAKWAAVLTERGHRGMTILEEVGVHVGGPTERPRVWASPRSVVQSRLGAPTDHAAPGSHQLAGPGGQDWGTERFPIPSYSATSLGARELERIHRNVKSSPAKVESVTRPALELFARAPLARGFSRKERLLAEPQQVGLHCPGHDTAMKLDAAPRQRSHLLAICSAVQEKPIASGRPQAYAHLLGEAWQTIPFGCLPSRADFLLVTKK